MNEITPNRSTFLLVSLGQLILPLMLFGVASQMKTGPRPGPLGDLTQPLLYLVCGVLLLGAMALGIAKLKWPEGPVPDHAAALRAGYQGGLISSAMAEMSALIGFIAVLQGWLTLIQGLPMAVGSMVAILGVVLPRGLAFFSEADRKR